MCLWRINCCLILVVGLLVLKVVKLFSNWVKCFLKIQILIVLIEGHTDDVPYKSSGTINDNWDLSTKRATAIVQILVENRQINPNNLTAAGRGEYAPISTNSTADGKARNRRIEVILTPKLDEVSKLLNQI